MFGFFGWMTMRPTCSLSRRPMFFHVLPPSLDLYTPSPHETLLRALASPVPTHTTSGSDLETATSPMEMVAWLSNTGVQVVPLFVVFHKPPDAAATYIELGLPSTTAMALIRPPMFAGPIGRGASWSRKEAGSSTASAAQSGAEAITTPKTPTNHPSPS